MVGAWVYALRGEWGMCCEEEEGSAIFLVGVGEE